MGLPDKKAIKDTEFKVIIKPNGHILYNGDIIAILGQWNKYEDLEPEEFINKERNNGRTR